MGITSTAFLENMTPGLNAGFYFFFAMTFFNVMVILWKCIPVVEKWWIKFEKHFRYHVFFKGFVVLFYPVMFFGIL